MKKGKKLELLDKKILEEMQNGIPVTPRPFKTIARKVGIEEEEVLSRVKLLKDSGLVRRVGAIFNHKELGYSSTLVGIKIAADKIEPLVQFINEQKGVTHNYVREHEYNLWFTLLAKSKKETPKTIDVVKNFPGVEDVLNLPPVRIFKLDVRFSLASFSQDVAAEKLNRG